MEALDARIRRTVEEFLGTSPEALSSEEYRKVTRFYQLALRLHHDDVARMLSTLTTLAMLHRSVSNDPESAEALLQAYGLIERFRHDATLSEPLRQEVNRQWHIVVPMLADWIERRHGPLGEPIAVELHRAAASKADSTSKLILAGRLYDEGKLREAVQLFSDDGRHVKPEFEEDPAAHAIVAILLQAEGKTKAAIDVLSADGRKPRRHLASYAPARRLLLHLLTHAKRVRVLLEGAEKAHGLLLYENFSPARARDPVHRLMLQSSRLRREDPESLLSRDDFLLAWQQYGWGGLNREKREMIADLIAGAAERLARLSGLTAHDIRPRPAESRYTRKFLWAGLALGAGLLGTGLLLPGLAGAAVRGLEAPLKQGEKITGWLNSESAWWLGGILLLIIVISALVERADRRSLSDAKDRRARSALSAIHALVDGMSGMAGLGRSFTHSAEQLWRRWVGAPVWNAKRDGPAETATSIDEWTRRVRASDLAGASDG
jgi:hypothetical protein